MRKRLYSFVISALAAVGAVSLPAAALAEDINLVVFGDSLTAGYELPADAAFPAQLQVKLRENGRTVSVNGASVSGDTSTAGLARLDWSIPDGTDGVIVELGANDALRGISPEVTRKNIEAIVTRLKERKIEVLVAGMLAPRNLGDDYAAAFDPIFKDVATAQDVLLYPFFLEGVATRSDLNLSDGMHPNREGVAVIVSNILPTVEELLARINAKKSQ